jgi:hypothetical protein
MPLLRTTLGLAQGSPPGLMKRPLTNRPKKRQRMAATSRVAITTQGDLSGPGVSTGRLVQSVTPEGEQSSRSQQRYKLDSADYPDTLGRHSWQ